MKKTVVFLFLSLILFTNSIAQNIRVKGTIVEKNEQASLPMVGVSLSLLTEDSTYVTGATSDRKGFFSIDGIKPGDYLLRISFISYQTEEILLKNLMKDFDLGTIEMLESSIELGEVTVTASNITQKVDRMIILPTQTALRNAYDTYELMNNLAIPRLLVNPITKTIETFGNGGVQTRINNIVASQSEVAALLARDILRIEVIENPGERYGDNSLGAVINLIVRKREDGGQVNIQTMNSPNVLWGENYASVKYNHNKSQWGLIYRLEDKKMEKTKKDITETYYLENKTIERIREGMYDKSEYYANKFDLSYNLSDPDKYTFNAVFRNNIDNRPSGDESNKLYEKGSMESIFSKTHLSRFSYTPALDVYFQKFLPNGQSIQFNVVGTMINTQDYRNYREYTEMNDELTQIEMDVDGKKKSIIGEAIYDKTMEKIKLSAGIRHSQMHAENEYAGTNPVVSSMNQMQTSAFAEFQGKIKNFSYLGSLGMTRSYFEEGNTEHSYYTFTPTLRLSFAPHKDGFITYRFNTTPSIPSLGSLSNVEQALDTIQIVRGNPELLPYRTYYNTLNYSYNQKKFTGALHVNYAFHDKRIMESVFPENGKLIIMDENQKSFQEIEVGGNIYLRNLDFLGLKDFLTLSVSGGMDKYWSNGNRYTHSYCNFYYDAQLMMNYKKFALIAQYRKNKNILLGETISKGENLTAFMGTYTYKNLQLGAGIMFPFTNNYRQGSERISSVAPVTTWTYVKESGQLAFIRLSYNFEFGKRYKSGKKRLNNSDSDSGVINTNR
jgi:hypothetical protein